MRFIWRQDAICRWLPLLLQMHVLAALKAGVCGNASNSATETGRYRCPGIARRQAKAAPSSWTASDGPSDDPWPGRDQLPRARQGGSRTAARSGRRRKQRSHSIDVPVSCIRAHIPRPSLSQPPATAAASLDLVGVLSINELVPIRCTASEDVQREGEKLGTST